MKYMLIKMKKLCPGGVGRSIVIKIGGDVVILCRKDDPCIDQVEVLLNELNEQLLRGHVNGNPSIRPMTLVVDFKRHRRSQSNGKSFNIVAAGFASK